MPTAPIYYVNNTMIGHPNLRAKVTAAQSSASAEIVRELNRKHGATAPSHHVLKKIATSLFELTGWGDMSAADLDDEWWMLLKIKAGGKEWLVRCGDNALMAGVLVRVFYLH